MSQLQESQYNLETAMNENNNTVGQILSQRGSKHKEKKGHSGDGHTTTAELSPLFCAPAVPRRRRRDEQRSRTKTTPLQLTHCMSVDGCSAYLFPAGIAQLV